MGFFGNWQQRFQPWGQQGVMGQGRPMGPWGQGQQLQQMPVHPQLPPQQYGQAYQQFQQQPQLQQQPGPSGMFNMLPPQAQQNIQQSMMQAQPFAAPQQTPPFNAGQQAQPFNQDMYRHNQDRMKRKNFQDRTQSFYGGF